MICNDLVSKISQEGNSVNFETLLKEKGLKATPQRIAILQEIYRVGHIAIEEIYNNIQKIYPSISLATVYKNIAAMCEAELLNEIKPSLQKQVYEINQKKHAHLICQKCKSLQDVFLDFHDMIQSIQELQHFQISNSTITLYGVCKECQK